MLAVVAFHIASRPPTSCGIIVALQQIAILRRFNGVVDFDISKEGGENIRGVVNCV
jgi:hypothetical protein